MAVTDSETPVMEVEKKKAKAKTKKKEAVAVNDLIISMVHELENLKKDDAITMMTNLIEETEFNNFKVGGLLSRIQEEGWWEGHDSFKDFVTDEFGMPYRKAMYLVAIYNELVESGVTWEQVKGVGWTKLKEIAKYLNEENVDEWVTRAGEMTTIQLQEYIKNMAGGEDSVGGAEEETPETTVSQMVFKVHADQREIIETAIDKAKEDNSTEYPAVALEYICQTFLEGGLGKAKKAGKQKTLKELMTEADAEEVLNMFDELHPEIDLTVSM